MHPSQQHPPELVNEVLKGIKAEWQHPVRQALESTPLWLTELVVVSHGPMLDVQWFTSRHDCHRWLTAHQYGMQRDGATWLRVDVEGRSKQWIAETVEREMSTVNWEPEF